MKVLIKIKGLSRYAQPRQGEFRYSPKYGAFIFTGEPVSIEQANKHFPRLAESYMRLISNGRREYLVVEVIEEPKEAKKPKKSTDVKKVVEDKPEDAKYTVNPKGRGRYDVIDSDGKVVEKNIFLKKVKELCPSYEPQTK